MESQGLVGLLLLGAAHGVNPGMGWLFAVARGYQEGSSRAVWGSLGPLAVGHGLAIAAAMGLAAMLGALVPMALLRPVIGAGLAIRGATLLVRHWHPRGRMRVGPGGLAWWSFLMATAHGAGLMALPLTMPDAHTDHMVSQLALGPAFQVGAIEATAAHAVGYLVVTGLLAVVVYEHIGVRILRSVWINLDVLWAGALILAGTATLLG